MGKKKRPPPEGEQQLPGLEDQIDRDLDALGRRLHADRAARIAAGKAEKSSEELLSATMRDKGVAHYKYKDLELFLDTTTKVKVKINGEQPTKEES